VITDATGSFSITGSYMCPSASSELYIVATGGNPGLGPSTNNNALTLMAALGPCSLHGGQYTLDPNSFISISEVTTVASVYALRGFMSAGSTVVGTSATNAKGLANAFALVNNLVDSSKGAALATTPAGNGTAPQAALNTLADVIATCVNSDGTGAACNALFAAASPSGGSVPTDTVQAVYNIASNPISNVSALYGLVPAAAPFQPTLAAAPNDWILAMTYLGGSPTNAVNYNSSSGLAIDADGSLWLLSSPFAGPANVLKFGNDGTLLSGAGGYAGGALGESAGIAIDPSGNGWVVGLSNANVVKLGSDGTVLSGADGYTGGGLSAPMAIAIDGNGNAWVSDSHSQALIKLSSTGTILSGSAGYSVPLGVGGIGIDRSGNVWGAENGTTLFEVNSVGGLISPAGGYSTGGVFSQQIGFDFAGDVWTNTAAQYTVAAKLNATGSLLSPAGGYATCTPPYAPTIAGRSCYWNYGQQFALDGAGHLWITGDTITSLGGRVPSIMYSQGIAELSNGGVIRSGAVGYTGGISFEPFGVGVDSGGDVWFESNGVTASLVEFVGAGTPVVTPFSVGVRDGTLGNRP
jgi:hypothetical protein